MSDEFTYTEESAAGKGFCLNPAHKGLPQQLARTEAERDSYREALAILADESNWSGNPRSHDALLFGHDTPYELAVAALNQEP